VQTSVSFFLPFWGFLAKVRAILCLSARIFLRTFCNLAHKSVCHSAGTSLQTFCAHFLWAFCRRLCTILQALCGHSESFLRAILQTVLPETCVHFLATFCVAPRAPSADFCAPFCILLHTIIQAFCGLCTPFYKLSRRSVLPSLSTLSVDIL